MQHVRIPFALDPYNVQLDEEGFEYFMVAIQLLITIDGIVKTSPVKVLTMNTSKYT